MSNSLNWSIIRILLYNYILLKEVKRESKRIYILKRRSYNSKRSQEELSPLNFTLI